MMSSVVSANILTFDIEHWYEGFRYRGISGWEYYPPRDHIIASRLLDLLGRSGQRATFFFTGRYAEEFPDVVRRAAAEGHEVASHSYAHNVLPKIADVADFRSDLLHSLQVLQDITGQKVKGYRAPKWSISPESRDKLLETMLEAGIEYDSSFFPGILGSPRRVCAPHRIQLGTGGWIWEIPATTLLIFGLRLPVAGGLYFRVLPQQFNHYALIHGPKSDHPGMVYLHPYDVDADCPRLAGATGLFARARYLGTGSAWHRLEFILRKFQFCSISDWISRQQDTFPAEPMR